VPCAGLPYAGHGERPSRAQALQPGDPRRPSGHLRDPLRGRVRRRGLHSSKLVEQRAVGLPYRAPWWKRRDHPPQRALSDPDQDRRTTEPAGSGPLDPDHPRPVGERRGAGPVDDRPARAAFATIEGANRGRSIPIGTEAADREVAEAPNHPRGFGPRTSAGRPVNRVVPRIIGRFERSTARHVPLAKRLAAVAGHTA